MTNQTTQQAQTTKTQSKASSGGVPVGWREACPPQNWRLVKLGEVVEVQNGYSFKSGDYVCFTSNEFSRLDAVA